MLSNTHSLSIAVAVSLAPVFAGAAEEAPMTVEGATTVTVEEAMELFDQGVAFIDVRKPSDFEAGRIPGAVNLDLKVNYTVESLGEVAKQTDPIVVYCNGVSCLRSSIAAGQAVSWGYEAVYYLRDGYPVWDMAGFPVE